MKTRGARARWAASPEGIAEAERLAAEEKAELDREAAAAAAAALLISPPLNPITH